MGMQPILCLLPARRRPDPARPQPRHRHWQPCASSPSPQNENARHKQGETIASLLWAAAAPTLLDAMQGRRRCGAGRGFLVRLCSLAGRCKAQLRRGSLPVGRRSRATPACTEYCLGYNLPRRAAASMRRSRRSLAWRCSATWPAEGSPPIVEICFKDGAWKKLNDQIIVLSNRRGQFKQVGPLSTGARYSGQFVVLYLRPPLCSNFFRPCWRR
ncbi:uncharacterized protein LOC125543495 isoform X2 [Triticum urartu]|uniref:Uncharacterized protein n=1 Tax=Triticum urartu TaxID=4572 RepID=A0A8R7TTM9_TRIUA|nr:uncharacterized protein LOC125543495 isoform X2 [Triticum urartu]